MTPRPPKPSFWKIKFFIEYISAVFSGLAEIENRNIRIFFIDQVVE